MAEKKALTDEELLAQFDDIPAHDVSAEGNGPRGAEAAAAAAPSSTDADAALAQLESLARPASRPGTPKRPSAAGLRTKSPKRSGLSTPPSIASARTSEDKAPTPQASSRSSESAGTKAHGDHEAIDAGRRNAESEAQAAGSLAQQGGGGGGWWGGIYATATAAVKQAEAAVKEIQKNEEAQKWTEQVMGNVGALRDLGMPGISSACSFRTAFS